ncbi:glutamate 5-kinase [Desulfuromusa kysingii]|uniref:Glutamate 5-kinase n=1 Tax=Desulfuromusa kysingii TaxID=37625 RepID=A0A1H4CKV6_9BACT|nr:glutamate 5-kinase [Desulfuromusa kysingii]SEA60692.1 glutamate 5-kinase [Desulfuromusa kysingii]
MRKALLAHVKRVVIKIGSGVISDAHGLENDQVASIATGICRLIDQGLEIIVVSSGAVAAGKRQLGINGRPQTIPQKQAAAAIGQTRIIHEYQETFHALNHDVAQVLLTRDDLSNRRRYLNARNTVMTLLEYGITPIVNENDTVVVEEIRFGDNDNLSALVTTLSEADLLIILSDVDGFYDQDPQVNPEAKMIPVVERITPEVESLGGKSHGSLGTGGMITKIKAAKRAGLSGVGTLIVNGRSPNILARVFSGEDVGTYFLPAHSKLTAKKHWIAFSKKPKGKLIVDEGGQSAVLKHGKSLLPSGICGVEGGFERGDAVRLCTREGKEFARGVISYSLAEVLQIMGKQCAEIEQVLGYKYRDEVVCRDNLVLAATDEEEIY